MKHRIHVPVSVRPGQRLDVGRNRAHYLLRVLRLRKGAEIECFTGAGQAWSARLVEAGPRTATLEIGPLLADEPEPQPPLHLVQGLLKGAAMDLVVQKSTELGATDLWPVLASRSNVPTGPERLERKHEHWQRVTESAAEQCRTLHLPRLHQICSLASFLAAPPQAALVLLDPGAPPLPLTLPRAATCLLIGPEGGWTDDERHAALAAGARRHGLGARVLRGETAPLAVLAAVRHGWGWV